MLHHVYKTILLFGLQLLKLSPDLAQGRIKGLVVPRHFLIFMKPKKCFNVNYLHFPHFDLKKTFIGPFFHIFDLFLVGPRHFA